MDEIYCEDCGAQFKNHCTCPKEAWEYDDRFDGTDRWVGVDGHAYIGNSRYPSSASHDDDNCRCPGSANFDPDSWY